MWLNLTLIFSFFLKQLGRYRPTPQIPNTVALLHNLLRPSSCSITLEQDPALQYLSMIWVIAWQSLRSPHDSTYVYFLLLPPGLLAQLWVLGNLYWTHLATNGAMGIFSHLMAV